MNKIDQIKALLGMEVKLEQAKLDNGTLLEAESFEAGKEIFIKSEDEDVALPKGRYTMEDGKVLVVEEDGIISAMKDKEEEPKEEDVEEQEMEAETPQAKKVVESVSKETHFAKVEELEALKKEVEELKLALQPKEEEKEVELSEEVPPIKHNPEGEAEKKEMFLYSQKAPKTTKSIIYNKLFNK
ncbi:hypothetical protein [uncultured Mediterranean phage uvMED]|nr:hypothetical protein [uncultured Mediterranean phage uvMED]